MLSPRPYPGVPPGQERLTGLQAIKYAGLIERTGLVWAAPFPLGQGAATIEIRSRRRPHPLLTVVRTPAGAIAALARLWGAGQ